MKKIIFSTIIASVLAFVGCQNEELVNDNVTDNSGKKVVLTANIQGAADSRVALTPDTDENENPIVKVAWRAFDSTNPETFVVYNNSNNSPKTFTQLSGNVFEGTLPESSNGYCAYYNQNLWISINKTKEFPQDGTLREEDVMMYAEFEEGDTSIEFEHLTAILKPTFTLGGRSINNTITSIEMGGFYFLEMGDVAITVTRPSQETPLAEDIYMTIPFYIYGGWSSFCPEATFTFSVKADDGKDYTGSFTIPEIDGWYPYGKLFTATIELTEAPSVSYVWTSSTVASESVEGEGTEASPYLIQSANDLQWMINQVAQKTIDDYEGVEQLPYYKLTHDLEIDSEEGATWTPIGTETNPFLGYFDGGGHTISGKMITAADVKYVGFFGYAGPVALITNLTNAANVTSLAQNLETCCVGGIVGGATGLDDLGYDNTTFIMACHNTGIITNNNTSGDTYIGGIAGVVRGAICIVACGNTGELVCDKTKGAIAGGCSRVESYGDYAMFCFVSCIFNNAYSLVGTTHEGILNNANYTYNAAMSDENAILDANEYIYFFNDFKGNDSFKMQRTITCNWHWELNNDGSVVLIAGAPQGQE